MNHRRTRPRQSPASSTSSRSRLSRFRSTLFPLSRSLSLLNVVVVVVASRRAQNARLTPRPSSRLELSTPFARARRPPVRSSSTSRLSRWWMHDFGGKSTTTLTSHNPSRSLQRHQWHRARVVSSASRISSTARARRRTRRRVDRASMAMMHASMAVTRASASDARVKRHEDVGRERGRGRPGRMSGRPSATTTEGRRESVVARANAKIKVLGCGGGGSNAVNRMISGGLQVRG